MMQIIDYFDKLNEQGIFNDVNIILIEKQLKINGIASVIMHHIHSWMMINFRDFKKTILYPPKNKTRILGAALKELDARIAAAWRRALARSPAPEETAGMKVVLAAAREHFAADADAAGRLLSVGGLPVAEDADRADLAAWTVAASVILNLDETISKP